MLESWTKALCAELGLDDTIDVDLILGMTADVAHNVARPAAPVSALIVGIAAGRAGGGEDAVADAAERQLRVGPNLHGGIR